MFSYTAEFMNNYSILYFILSYGIGIFIYINCIKFIELKYSKVRLTQLQKAIIFALINAPILTRLGLGNDIVLYVFPSYIGIPHLFFFFSGQLSLLGKAVYAFIALTITMLIAYIFIEPRIKGDANLLKDD